MRLFCLLVLLWLSACRASAAPTVSAPSASPRGLVRPDTPPEVDIVRARARGLAPTFTWMSWGPEAFERAKRERRFLLIDGAAEWCHGTGVSWPDRPAG